MNELVCLTLLSHAGESEADFQGRLSTFWTHMLRNHEADYEQVYAEASKSEHRGEYVTRQYMLALDVAAKLTQQLAAGGIDHDPIDEDDIYNKYEATSPNWFQIEH